MNIDKYDDNVLNSIKDYLLDVKGKNRSFLESIDLSIKLIFPRYDIFKSKVLLPHGYGAKANILILTDDPDFSVNSENNVDVVVANDSDIPLLSDKKKLSKYSYCLAKSSIIKNVARYGRILSSKGLMPNVKFGTVVDDISAAIEDISVRGMIIYKSDKSGIINVKIGNLEFSESQIFDNIKSIIDSVLNLSQKFIEEGNSSDNKHASKKSKFKKNYKEVIDKLYLSSTMSDGSLRINSGCFVN
ncbi:hypothetical protein GUI12_03420 [Anaplasmataceae bacterium AB001_6]|nr:hypothetical protein GUI12_03420 [Anaplasmataceae bacterium AB001_6]